MNISYNPEVGSKTINVFVPGCLSLRLMNSCPAWSDREIGGRCTPTESGRLPQLTEIT